MPDGMVVVGYRLTDMEPEARKKMIAYKDCLFCGAPTGIKAPLCKVALLRGADIVCSKCTGNVDFSKVKKIVHLAT